MAVQEMRRLLERSFESRAFHERTYLLRQSSRTYRIDDASRLLTKLRGPGHGNVLETFNKSLKALGLDYIDLYLMHWPLAEDPQSKDELLWSDYG